LVGILNPNTHIRLPNISTHCGAVNGLFGRPELAGWCWGWTSQPSQPIPATSYSQQLIFMLISNFQIQIEY